MKNLTTATAVTSNGQPAPAGLSTTRQQRPAAGHAARRARRRSATRCCSTTSSGTTGPAPGPAQTVTGIGARRRRARSTTGTSGVADGTGQLLAPTNSVIQQNAGAHAYTTSPTNSAAEPGRRRSRTTSRSSFATWRQNPAFVDATLVTVEAPAEPAGRLPPGGCPARRLQPRCGEQGGAVDQQPPPTLRHRPDIDDQVRPALGGFDAGADEFGAVPRRPRRRRRRRPATSRPRATPTRRCRRHRRRRRHLQLGRHRLHPGHRTPTRRTACRPAPTSTASTGSTPPTSTCPSPARHDRVPGLAGRCQDEDVVYYNDGTWSLYFDGTRPRPGRRGTTSTRSASSAGPLYFSTDRRSYPPGVGGTGDDADIYRWNGGTPTPGSWDAIAPTGCRRPPTSTASTGSTPRTSTCPSAATSRPLPGVGAVQDEDVVYDNGRHLVGLLRRHRPRALTADNLDVDAFDVP